VDAALAGAPRLLEGHVVEDARGLTDQREARVDARAVVEVHVCGGAVAGAAGVRLRVAALQPVRGQPRWVDGESDTVRENSEFSTSTFEGFRENSEFSRTVFRSIRRTPRSPI